MQRNERPGRPSFPETSICRSPMPSATSQHPSRRARHQSENPAPSSTGGQMSTSDEYLRNNAAYADQFTGPLPLPPSKGTAVIACMAARLNLYAILALNDAEPHVIRTPAA